MVKDGRGKPLRINPELDKCNKNESFRASLIV